MTCSKLCVPEGETPALDDRELCADCILEAVARFAWWQEHKKDCPATMIPTVDQLGTWIKTFHTRGVQTDNPLACLTLSARIPSGLNYNGFTLESYIQLEHKQWQRQAEVEYESPSLWPKHPLIQAIALWQQRPKRPDQTRLLITRERKPPKGQDPFRLARMPAPAALLGATLEAVVVDGEPVVTELPDSLGKGKKWMVSPPQGTLFPAPKTLNKNATAGAMFEAAADLRLTGDERSPLRPDMIRMAVTASALIHPIRITESEGAIWIAGKDTPEARKRFNAAMWALRGMRYEVRRGIYWALVDAMPGEISRLGPADWWREQKPGMKAYRLSGAMFRFISIWGVVARTIAGLEGALTWGPSAGGGRGGRLPDYLRPIRPGGPGPAVFVPWWQVLRLSGEPVDSNAQPQKLSYRFHRRIKLLREEGYFVQGGRMGTAPAGDTVEITRQQSGRRSRRSGIYIRASARFCAAYAKGERIRISATEIWTPDHCQPNSDIGFGSLLTKARITANQSPDHR